MPPDQPSPGAGHAHRTPQPDEVWLKTWLASAWRRWRLWHLARCALLGVGAALLMHALVAPYVSSPLVVAALAGALVAIGALAVAPGVRDLAIVVLAIEDAHRDLRNALFTWHERQATLSQEIAARLAGHARQTLHDAAPLRAGSRRAWGAALSVLTIGVLAGVIPSMRSATTRVSTATSAHTPPAAAIGTLDWQVVVTPPTYSGRRSVRHARPEKVEALAGSRVQVSFTGWPPDAVAQLGEEPVPLSGDATSPVVSLVAATSDVLLVRDHSGKVLASLTLLVVPDAAPTVRVTAPAADLRRATPAGTVTIEMVSRDDLGLRDLRLRFTKVSGSGESFTFEDGEWPVAIRKASATEWTGAYTLDLARAGLGPGDSIAYHAIAHDARLGPEGAAESERFLIEIARPGAAISGDFSLPEPEDRFALSQRMVIQMTERLLERRPRMTAEEFRQQAQTLAIAQRRVKAEFIFMLGGEVEDEFEEAAHSHEVEAGRLDNRGQGDLTEAVRQMSQAETRLTNASVQEALPYEYKALAALQSAFGKARYFMRTLPTPVQIDANRRLQGDRSSASSSRWATTPLSDAGRAAALDLLQRIETPGAAVMPLLPQLVALDRADAAWVARLQRAASEGDAADVARALRARLLPGSATWMAMPLPRSMDEATLAVSGAKRP